MFSSQTGRKTCTGKVSNYSYFLILLEILILALRLSHVTTILIQVIHFITSFEGTIQDWGEVFLFHLEGGFEAKNFSYTCSLFKGKHCMKSKIIEYGILLLHKYKIEQTEVISGLLFIFVTHKLHEY